MDHMTKADGLGHEGFAQAYEADPDPEFPPDGAWAYPVFAFDRDGRVRADFVSRWGAPRIVRVRPTASPEWVGMFPSGGLGGVSGVFATPSPDRVCVLVDGQAYLVRSDAPEEGAVAAQDTVQQVIYALEPQLLLLASSFDIVALGPGGVAWRSPRLALDGLRVGVVDADGIHCTGVVLPGDTVSFVVDPTSGQVSSGPHMGDDARTDKASRRRHWWRRGNGFIG